MKKDEVIKVGISTAILVSKCSMGLWGQTSSYPQAALSTPMAVRHPRQPDNFHWPQVTNTETPGVEASHTQAVPCHENRYSKENAESGGDRHADAKVGWGLLSLPHLSLGEIICICDWNIFLQAVTRWEKNYVAIISGNCIKDKMTRLGLPLKKKIQKEWRRGFHVREE
jgi:hypothetical protein